METVSEKPTGLGMGRVVALVFVTGLALIATSLATARNDVRAGEMRATDVPQLFASASAITKAAKAPLVPMVAKTPAGVTRFRGLGFDICKTPSLATMRAWSASPYRAIGVYISGPGRACRKQPHLTPQWVASVTAAGWSLIPIDVNRQAPCGRWTHSQRAISHERAREQGAWAARNSVRAAKELGMLEGSALYSDIEYYGRKPSARCNRAVADYLHGWTEQLHALGYLAGVYGHVASGMPQISALHVKKNRPKLDAVWMAQWDQRRNLKDWPKIPNGHWADRQRIKQYRGDHFARHGGVGMYIDSNVVDAPVARVSRGGGPR
ncbi:MAG: glycoside hydrolase domain-containing protein [Sporichthyaceae bacterium]